MHAKYLHIFTAQAAVAIKNAQVHEQEKALAIQAERQHLARELHDAVTQSLFASKLIADSLPQTLRENPEKLEESLEELKLLNESTAAEMRMLLLELRPTQLLKARLSDHLRHLATALKGRKRIQLRLDIRENYPIPPEIQFALDRIAREAMNNTSNMPAQVS